MATTMTLIAKQTVGSAGTSSVTFSSIPQTYTDLKIVVSARNTSASLGTGIDLALNGTATTAGRIIFGDGTTTYTATNPSSSISGGTGTTANIFSNGDIYICNYRSTSSKAASGDGVMENNTTNSYAVLYANLWGTVTNAVTSLTLTVNDGSNFPEFSTFYLYGISNDTTTQNASVPYAYGGDVITTDGTYWYHAFKYSGSFTPLKNLTADVLVVAGGGGGSISGGGAGGLLAFLSQALTNATNYTCTIGAGGAGGVSGGDSQFGALTLVKGGGRGAYNSNGVTGGSGGGAGTGTSTTYAGGSPTSGQGNAGGNATASSSGNEGGAGGGGAGAAGQTMPGAGQGGDGGAGVNTYSSWASATSTGASGYFAGGGAGSGKSRQGTGGAGGGGNAGNPATAGTANTGGGGGGNVDASSAAGGSGIIIVRYAV